MSELLQHVHLDVARVMTVWGETGANSSVCFSAAHLCTWSSRSLRTTALRDQIRHANHCGPTFHGRLAQPVTLQQLLLRLATALEIERSIGAKFDVGHPFNDTNSETSMLSKQTSPSVPRNETSSSMNTKLASRDSCTSLTTVSALAMTPLIRLAHQEADLYYAKA